MSENKDDLLENLIELIDEGLELAKHLSRTLRTK